MAAHDVSAELRGYHGRWSRTGVLKRLASEAAKGQQTDQARAAATLEDVHKRVQEAANLPEGKGKGVAGILVANMGNKGIKVRLPGATKHYKDPREAAVAVYRKEHHDEGHSPIPLPGTRAAPGSPLPEPPKAEPPTFGNIRGQISNIHQGETVEIGGHKVTSIGGGRYDVSIGGDKKRYHSALEVAHAVQTGKHSGRAYTPASEKLTSSEISNELYNVTKSKDEWNIVNKTPVRYNPEGTWDIILDGKIRTYHSVTDATLAIYNQEHHRFGTLIPGTLEHDNEFRKLAKPPAAGEVAHPKSLEVKIRAEAEDKKRMRQQILKATTLQAQATPALVAKTDVTITRSPHGSKDRRLASHSGVGNTLHVKPDVLIGNNAQNVLDHQRDVGWWVPTDKQHDLSMNVMIHEFGHGVHGDLSKRGILMANRNNPLVFGKPEQDFWRQFANTIGVPEPRISEDAYGRKVMDIPQWHRNNNRAIKKAVSQYGGHNINEMIAELWTEYRLSSSPRPAAKTFGNYVMGRMNE
jgi:hypothetical protein